MPVVLQFRPNNVTTPKLGDHRLHLGGLTKQLASGCRLKLMQHDMKSVVSGRKTQWSFGAQPLASSQLIPLRLSSDRRFDQSVYLRNGRQTGFVTRRN